MNPYSTPTGITECPDTAPSTITAGTSPASLQQSNTTNMPTPSLSTGTSGCSTSTAQPIASDAPKTKRRKKQPAPVEPPLPEDITDVVYLLDASPVDFLAISVFQTISALGTSPDSAAQVSTTAEVNRQATKPETDPLEGLIRYTSLMKELPIDGIAFKLITLQLLWTKLSGYREDIPMAFLRDNIEAIRTADLSRLQSFVKEAFVGYRSPDEGQERLYVLQVRLDENRDRAASYREGHQRFQELAPVPPGGPPAGTSPAAEQSSTCCALGTSDAGERSALPGTPSLHPGVRSHSPVMPGINFSPDRELNRLANVLFTPSNRKQSCDFRGRTLLFSEFSSGSASTIRPDAARRMAALSRPATPIDLPIVTRPERCFSTSGDEDSFLDALSVCILWVEDDGYSKLYAQELKADLERLVKTLDAKTIGAAVDTFSERIGWSLSDDAQFTRNLFVLQRPLGTTWEDEEKAARQQP